MNYRLTHIPARTSKPREAGLNMVMDKGLSIRQAEDLIDASGTLVDMVKIGFGTSYVTPRLKEKIKLYQKADMRVYLGGTLFEAFIARGMFKDYRKLLDDLGLQCAEVSDGSINLQIDAMPVNGGKLQLRDYVARDAEAGDDPFAAVPLKAGAHGSFGHEARP